MSALTIQELINELEKIEDKNKKIFYDDEDWGLRTVNEIVEDLDGDFIIKSWN